MCQPFLRWPGAKRRHLSSLLAHVPSDFGAYYEPFVGAGSLFFALEPGTAVLGDQIRPLVKTYSAVRDAPGAVHKYTLQWPVDRPSYYEVRGLTLSNRFERAAQFIYLNRTCWNGLYRVNSAGHFNVPFGIPKTSNIVSRDTLVACSRALSRNVLLLTQDFEETLDHCRKGDLVYLDPPYVTGHNNNGFIDYNEQLFGWADQERLALVAETLASRGVHVIVTNADHEAVRTLYDGFTIQTLTSFSTLAGAARFRRPTTEIIASTSRSAQ